MPTAHLLSLTAKYLPTMMLKTILLTAALTGMFCAGFALFIDWATDMLMRNQVIWISFLSGFLGSIFAQTILGRWREKNK